MFFFKMTKLPEAKRQFVSENVTNPPTNNQKIWTFDGFELKAERIPKMVGFNEFNVWSWKAKCPIFKAVVAGFRGKVA